MYLPGGTSATQQAWQQNKHQHCHLRKESARGELVSMRSTAVLHQQSHSAHTCATAQSSARLTPQQAVAGQINWAATTANALTAYSPLAGPLPISKGRRHLLLQAALTLEALIQPVELWSILRRPTGSCRCRRGHGKPCRRQTIRRTACASVARDEAAATLR